MKIKALLTTVTSLITGLFMITTNTLAATEVNRTEAINYLNEIRVGAGITPLERNYLLDQAAQGHSNYLTNTEYYSGHIQTDTSSTFFIGQFPIDRIENVGFFGTGVGEGIAPIKITSKQAVEDLIDAPFHRINSINPGHKYVGIGSNENGFTVLNFSSLENSYSDGYIVKYPYNNQTNIKPIWFNNEEPNPLKAYGGLKFEYVGYPIMLSAYGMEISGITYRSHTLVDDKGNTIDSYIIHSGNESQATKHIMVIPKEPLALNTTYTVTINAAVDYLDKSDENIRETWSFRTVEKHELEKLDLTESNELKIYFKTGELDDYHLKVTDPETGTLIQSYKVQDGEKYNYKPFLLNEGDYVYTLESKYFEGTITGAFEIALVYGQYILIEKEMVNDTKPLPEPPEEPEEPVEPTEPDEDEDNEPSTPEEPNEDENDSDNNDSNDGNEEKPVKVIGMTITTGDTIQVQFNSADTFDYSVHLYDSKEKETLEYSRKEVNGKSYSFKPTPLTEGVYWYLVNSERLEETAKGWLEIIGDKIRFLDNNYTPPLDDDEEEEEEIPSDPNDNEDEGSQDNDEEEENDNESTLPDPSDFRKEIISKLISSKLELTIRLTDSIDRNTLNDSTIFMYDENNQRHPINYQLTGNKNSIKFSSKIGYESGVTYTLYITDKIKSTNGKKLSQPIMVIFTGK